MLLMISFSMISSLMMMIRILMGFFFWSFKILWLLFKSYNILEGDILDISIDSFLKLNNPNVIDIRMRQKYNDNHIPGAINVSSNELLNNPEKFLNPNLTYYIYCQKGTSSRTLAQVLRVKGYNVFNIIGGYEAWILKK